MSSVDGMSISFARRRFTVHRWARFHATLPFSTLPVYATIVELVHIVTNYLPSTLGIEEKQKFRHASLDDRAEIVVMCTTCSG